MRDEGLWRRRNAQLGLPYPLDLVAPSSFRRSVGSHCRNNQRRQEEERSTAPDWHESGVVFTTTSGTPIDPRNVKRWLDALCDRAGIRRIRAHDLRHTCASLLLAQGVHPRIVMDTLGHSQMAVTMDIYSHVMPAAQQEAARQMQRALGRRTGREGRGRSVKAGRRVAVKTAVKWPPATALIRKPPVGASALGGIRTPNLLIRSQMLWSIELRAPESGCDLRFSLHVIAGIRRTPL
jgi:hypothetical protein